ncbi:MAG TPA: NUDIX domain-containing protein, partial [Pyrinomonadaceae bacterium]|nr:NUDIX domain-containing protein [Pyrinomonadaceae bacterium]
RQEESAEESVMSATPTKTQISAGGVVFRRRRDDSLVEVALISVGGERRWQLPKGLVDAGESAEAAAMREAREETGVETELVAPLDKIEYWYYATNRGGRVRFHKFVYFYLLRYLSGDVRDHDAEVNEARWVEIDEARTMLAFAGERKVVERAREMLAAGHDARNE